MQFIDTTPWRLVQVAVGWIAGLGTVASYLTMGELTSGFAVAPVAILTVTGAAWLVFLFATMRIWAQRRNNVSFFANASAAGVLRSRRRTERVAGLVRGITLAAFLAAALAFIILVMQAQCGPDEDCGAKPEISDQLIAAVQYVALAFGAAFGAAASFVRVYTGETDDIELKALRHERHDDGTPGLSKGRWD